MNHVSSPSVTTYDTMLCTYLHQPCMRLNVIRIECTNSEYDWFNVKTNNKICTNFKGSRLSRIIYKIIPCNSVTVGETAMYLDE